MHAFHGMMKLMVSILTQSVVVFLGAIERQPFLKAMVPLQHRTAPQVLSRFCARVTHANPKIVTFVGSASAPTTARYLGGTCAGAAGSSTKQGTE
jgi:hypothetical protein